MNNIYNLKILIVGLTTVLSFISFSTGDFYKQLVENPDLNFNKVI